MPGEVRSHTETADVAAQGNLPGRREFSDGTQPDEWIDPVLAPFDGRSADDIDLVVDVRVSQATKALQRPGPWLPGGADRPAAKALQPADLDKSQVVRGIRSQRTHRDVVIPELDIGNVQEDTDVITLGFTMNHESHERVGGFQRVREAVVDGGIKPLEPKAREASSSGAQPPANHGFAVDFSNVEFAIQQCAGCHSRREPYLDGNPPPGKPYHDSYNLSLLAPGLYHADGQILDEVYVYGSFLQSKMYRAGVSCMNCHDPHNAEIKFTGNTLCAQCHNPVGNPAFPSLKPASFDSPSHHFHEPGTPGAQCVNCHMVERVYMGVDGRRDHSFRIPRPDFAAQTGAPDACTGCHTDRGADWAAARIAEWYPSNENRRRHFGVTLALGRKDPAAAADALADFALDTSEPGIARATALRLLEGLGRPAAAERAEPLLRDPDPLVRVAAIGVQRLAPPQNRVPRVVALLEDPVRNVRMAAAQAMLDAPVARLPKAMAADLRGAMAEWRASLSNRLDFPETHIQLGGLALTLRNMPAATTAFRETLRMDPQRVEAWVMLARISAATRGVEAARSP